MNKNFLFRPVLALATLVLATVIFFSGNLQAKIYKWVDENGNIQFTDDLGKVPAKKRSQAEHDMESDDSDSNATISVVPGSKPRRDNNPADREPGKINKPEPPRPDSQVPAAPESKPDTDKAQHDQSYWQDQKQKAQDDLNKAQQQLDQVYQDRRKNLESGPGMQERQANLAKQEAELKTKIESLKRDLDENIPAAARTEGAPPGWAR